jgi:hypothetical protein
MANQKDDVIKVKSDWNIPFTHTAGVHATKFFKEMKENKKLSGTKCPNCERVLMPPRPFCERCFTETNEWVEVKDEGEIVAVSINYIKYAGLPEPPYAIAFIKLDGADTSIVYTVGGVDLSNPDEAKEKVKIGTRVKAVWKEERIGMMSDIKYFEPIT